VLVQHLVLAVGMLGGAIAARDNRLLALSAAAQWFKGGALTFARVVGYGFAAAVSTALAVASWDFVLSQRRAREDFRLRRAGVGRAACAGGRLRPHRGAVVWHPRRRGGGNWRHCCSRRRCSPSSFFVNGREIDPEPLRWPAMVVLLVSVALGAQSSRRWAARAHPPLDGREPVTGRAAQAVTAHGEPVVADIPLFTLAGYFLAESGAAKRLVRLFLALFGSLRGGPAIVTSLVCAFFTSFTGGSGATILALGGVLMPVLAAAKYSERSSLGLLTGAGSLGMLFPPCLPPILYAIIASSGGEVSISIEQMFQGGFLPGVLLVALTVGWGLYIGRHSPADTVQPFDRREALAAIWAAKWELLVPVVALAALFGGFATPVEAAALTAAYTFLISVAIHRDLNLFRDVPRVMAECGLSWAA
jgi:hypothetical protein